MPLTISPRAQQPILSVKLGDPSGKRRLGLPTGRDEDARRGRENGPQFRGSGQAVNSVRAWDLVTVAETRGWLVDKRPRMGTADLAVETVGKCGDVV